MNIVANEQLKDVIEWTCKYASEYKVDIDIHIDADGEISVSVCPTYRDKDADDTPQTEIIELCDNPEGVCEKCWKELYCRAEDFPRTGRSGQ